MHPARSVPAVAPPRARAAVGIEDRLAWRLVVAGRLVRTMADDMLAGHGIGGQALAAVLRLAEEDGLTQVELARRQRVEAPTMCRMVDRLERMGLVARERRTDDRRALRVVLTPEGRQVARRGRDVVEHLEARAFAALDSAERAALAALLAKVLDALAGAETTA
jgi:DNA-binding MarR family transcriptional regulator